VALATAKADDPLKGRGTAMKVLVSVAVFGLMPVPPMPDTLSSSVDGARTKSEDVNFSQLVFLSRPIPERLATKEELAHIRDELEGIYVESEANAKGGGRHHTCARKPSEFLPPPQIGVIAPVRDQRQGIFGV
jgi:hypothetical protein